MGKQQKREPDLSEWYKPSREGAEARRILMQQSKEVLQSEEGSIGVPHEKKQRRNRRK